MDNLNDTSAELPQWMTFSPVEYVVFFGMLGVSALIGVYFGLIKGHQDTVVEYMLGGKKMSVLPVSLSLLAGDISGILLLGLPEETYVYGTQVLATVITHILVVFFLTVFLLPVYYPLQLTSVFEYLEMRFDRRVRVIASLLFAVHLFSYIPVVIYVPALAFKQVTGMSVLTLSPIVCVICIFYTSLGGVKAVVWSDTFQSIFIFLSVIIVSAIGTYNVGGFWEVMRISGEGDRLHLFNMDPDIFARETFWTTVTGSFFGWMGLFACSPAVVQRYISLPTYKDSITATLFFGFSITVIKALVIFTGLIIYAKYHDCDPVLAGTVEKPGQILPYYVMDVAKNLPGLSGLFISGIFSAALSTMSTGLNTIAGTIFEDLIKPALPWKLSEARSSQVIKVTVVILGVICTSLVILVEKLGGIVQMTVSLGGIASGPIFFLFMSGMFLPWVNTKGAITGSLTTLLVMGWIVIGSQFANMDGDIWYYGRPRSVEGCPNNITVNPDLMRFNNDSSVGFSEDLSYIYRISFFHFNTMGALMAFAIGTLVTLLTGLQDTSVLDPRLIVPQMRRFLREPVAKTQEEIKLTALGHDNNVG